jgi:hypothetical protein
MAATILDVRYQIRDVSEPYTFPDEVIQRSLNEAADFIYRKYYQQGSLMRYAQGNDTAIMPIQNGTFGMGRGFGWADYWLSNQYNISIDTPVGGRLQRLMASVDLMTSMLMPTSDRTPTGVSEGGLSIQWGGSYESAIQVWNDEIQKLMFSLEAPFFCMYNNY